MHQQDRAGVANHVKDVARGRAAADGRPDDAADRAARGLSIDGQFHQVAHRQHPVGLEHVLVLVEAELSGEHPAMRGSIPLPASIRTIGAKRRSRSSDSIIASRSSASSSSRSVLALRVTRKNSHDVDLGLREEQVEVVRHHVFERDEAPGAVDPQKARDAEPERHLDARQQRLGVVGVAHRDQQIERQVGDERKRMRGVHRLRRHQRKNVAR